MYNRRSFLKSIAGYSALASMPLSASTKSNVRIIVVGGGVAGTRAAAYLKVSHSFSEITLFDPSLNTKDSDRNYSAIENMVRPVSKQLLDETGIDIITEKVVEIDPSEKSVRLTNGKQYKADFLVIAPGIDFKWQGIHGYNSRIEHSVLHAWQHDGAEITLWRQLESMRDGDTVIVSVPVAPYRYPQGPYQRATRIACYLKVNKPRSTLLLLDSNNAFPSMQAYRERWRDMFPDGTLQWVPAVMGGAVDHLDFQKNIIYTAGETIKAGVLNFIPPQQAGIIARQAHLNVNSDWCQVSQQTLESSHYNNVYVLGDANDSNNNKTALMAEQHAIKCLKSINKVLRV